MNRPTINQAFMASAGFLTVLAIALNSVVHVGKDKIAAIYSGEENKDINFLNDGWHLKRPFDDVRIFNDDGEILEIDFGKYLFNINTFDKPYISAPGLPDLKRHPKPYYNAEVLCKGRVHFNVAQLAGIYAPGRKNEGPLTLETSDYVYVADFYELFENSLAFAFYENPVLVTNDINAEQALSRRASEYALILRSRLLPRYPETQPIEIKADIVNIYPMFGADPK
jgi:hypothetical protein